MLRKIASFTINHDTLTPGMYVSRVDGDCITYDLRCKWPNKGDYLAQAPLHTIEPWWPPMSAPRIGRIRWCTSAPWAAVPASI